MDFAADLPAMLKDFGVGAVVDGVSMSVIFDNAYIRADVGTGMATTSPAITLPTASVPASPRGKAVAVGGVNYKVAAHEPDGTGMSVLFLELA